MKQKRHREGGYALLLVCAMAASIAVMLYMEIPRVAFEAQRDKEQLLIDRGEQYTRAVQLYVRKYNRFPADIAALENTQSIRFLRKQYIDPMTGKSEWRLIHVGPGGVFTDSLVHKAKKDTNAPQTFITELQQIGGGGGPAGAEGVNLATRRRPSDGPSGQGDPFNPAGGAQSQPGGQPQPGQTPMNGPVMVLPDGRIVPANASGQASSAGGIQPGQGQMIPPGGQLPNGTGVQNSAGQFGFPMQGANGLPSGFQNQANGVPGPPPNAAANLINQILTTPRPGGLNGTDTQSGAFGQQQGGAFGQAVQAGVSGGFGTPVQGAAGGQVIGGGIAGVASKAEREGIKVYGEKSSYHEWEFVYDMTKDPARGGGRGGVVPQTGQPGSAPGTQNGAAPGSGMNPGGFPGSVPQR